MASTVKVRMFQMGFGDSFLVTVTGDDGATWRILIDCGVHRQSRDRPIEESVAAIIDDLTIDGTPSVDVIVATHMHEDHIAGFGDAAWEDVQVGEVWLPWVEHPTDPLADTLRTSTNSSAVQLLRAAEGGRESPELTAAAVLAANNNPRTEAVARLTKGRSEESGQQLGFGGDPTIRFLPEATASPTIEGPWPDVRVHVLGPSRDVKRLRRMDPPASKEWLAGFAFEAPGAGAMPFRPEFRMDELAMRGDRRFEPVLAHANRRRGLDHVLDAELLLATTLLERWRNNTSLFLVIEVGGRRLIFPGDAQQGAWEHVLDDPFGRNLLAQADFYKISHHGSHNGTPRDFVESIWQKTAPTMLPYGSGTGFDKIPKPTLMTSLGNHAHAIHRSDQPKAAPDVTVAPDGTWSEIAL